MTTTPSSYAVITSTEAARILRTNPHDPLAWRRLDQLRASGQLRPVGDPIDIHGPRFLRSHVERLARPWEHPEVEGLDDPLREARGMVYGVLIGAGLFAAVGLIAWWIL